MEKKEIRLLVIGKTGNGKSALCNSILGKDVFKTGRSMSPTTQTAQEDNVRIKDLHVHVVDTPDVTNLEMPSSQMQKEVARWKSMMEPFPSAVLLAIRCDVRYTAEEHDIYKKFLKLWGDDSIKQQLIVVFTFGDRQERTIEEELLKVPKLTNVLNDTSGSLGYVVFDNTRNNNMAVQELLKKVQEIKDQVQEGLTPWMKFILEAMIAQDLHTAFFVTEISFMVLLGVAWMERLFRRGLLTRFFKR